MIIELGIISQKRLQRDYQEAVNKSKTNALNGKAGGLKTAEKWKSYKANAVASSEGSAEATRPSNGSSRSIGEVLNQLEL